MSVELQFNGRAQARIFEHIEALTRPTTADVVTVLLNQRDRLLARRKRGLDYDEKPSAPYSTKGPIYLYLSRRATARVARALGIRRGGAAKIIRVKGMKKQYAERTAKGLKFSSYAAMKKAFGHSTVDLRGVVGSDRMLDHLVVEVGGQRWNQVPYSTDGTALEGRLTIEGPKGDLAAKHQKGDPSTHLPRRPFIGVTANDEVAMAAELGLLMADRIGRGL